MKILFLTQIIPYPPDAGPKVKTWHVLRYLSGRGHQVILASFVRPEEQPHVAALRQVCSQVHTVPIRRSRLADVGYWLRAQLSGRPFLIERDDLPPMRALVERLAHAEAVDVIHADQLTMALYALPFAGGGRPRLVFDAHNAVWTIVERMRQNAPFFLQPLAAQEAHRVRRYEAQIVEKFDLTLAVTEPDRLALSQGMDGGGAERIHVVPIAVDAGKLQPVQRRPGSTNILTLGTLHYPPNADGIRWFLQAVFPLVRQQALQATLTIIGKNPPADFLQAAERDPQAIEVTGYVPDLRPRMEQAALVAVPVRAGGGMRVRILEAFALGMPVVTTTVGLEGIQAEPGRDVLVADTPEGFAAAVLRVLTEPGLADSLAANGRRLAEQRYDWQVVLRQMDQLYANLDSAEYYR